MRPNLENIKALAQLIAVIPARNFSMVTFMHHDTYPNFAQFIESISLSGFKRIQHDCSSTGCIIGWGTFSPELNPQRFNYEDYSALVLGIPQDTILWEALFDQEWSEGRSQAQQHDEALARLHVFIDHLEADPDWDFNDWAEDQLEVLHGYA